AALKAELAELRSLFSRSDFGAGPDSIGLELELNLVDAAGRPLPINQRVLAFTGDPRVALEVNRFNLEINTEPELLAGQPFRALHTQLVDTLGSVQRAALVEAGSAVAIG